MKKALFAGAVLAAFFASATFALDEDELQKKMKAAGKSGGEIRKAMQAQSMPEVTTHAKNMVDALSGVEEFWKSRNMMEAVKWQVDGLEGAKDLVVASESGNTEGVRKAMSKMNGACKQCHEKHREKIAENKYRIKQ